jgi:predicted dehydrogenase
MKRRHFLGMTALGASAAIGYSTLSGFSMFSGRASQKRPLGIALVGLGSYSTYQLAPALEKTERIELRGVVTGTPSKAEEWAKKYNLSDKNIYSYDTFDQIAGNPDIDVVYIVLPNSMHAEYTIQAAEAGKHVICEKPMAVSVKECDDMIAACKKAKVHLGIGYRLHYEPHIREVMRLSKEKAFGEWKTLFAEFGFRIGDPTQWRLKQALAGGGPLMDLGVYCLQGICQLTDQLPVAITAQQVKTDPVKFAEVEETLMWQMQYESGLMASCVTTYNANIHRLHAAGENGWLEMGPAYVYGGLKGRSSKGDISFPEVNQQARQIDGFADVILQNAPNLVPGEMGRRDMVMVEAIYEAMRTGTTVKPEDF